MNEANTAVRNVYRTIRARHKTLRNGIVNIVRHVPMASKVSNEYLYGCVDAAFTTVAFIAAVAVIRRSSRRFATVEDIPVQLVRREATLKGIVAAVRDGDNLRVRHIPPMERIVPRLFRKGKVTGGSSTLSQTTINIRLAAIDAPECTHGLQPGQPYGAEARLWLRNFTLKRHVSFRLHSIDQYRRVVATVHRDHQNPILRALGLGKRNVGLELTRAGYATLYRGANAQYGGPRRLRQYERTEQIAKNARRGMWADGTDAVTSPGDFKRMLRDGLVNKSDGSPNSINLKRNSSAIDRFIHAAMSGYEWLKRFR